MKTHFTHIALFVCLISSLQGQAQQPDTAKSIDYTYQETFNIRPALYDKICDRLQLTELSKSLDSFSLRLWTGGMFGYQLMIINKVNGSWKSFKYSYTTENNIKEEKFKQNISITTLLVTLNSIDFKKFKNQNEIEGFNDNVADGVTYTLEVLYNNSFRILQYHAPHAFKDKDNMIFQNLLNILSKHFDFL
jgi:hypothetical protein